MNRLVFKFGFTLVELLVVVALIGILAVAVLSTINPIEQANRARDAKYKNDAAEIVNALERYYTTIQNYPWSTTTDPFVLNWVSASSVNPNVGICDVADGCPTAGTLITGQELRNEFAQREAFDTTIETDRLFVGRSDTSSGSVYVCFVPKSNTTRNTAGTGTTTLKQGEAVDGTVTVSATGPSDCTTAPSASDWNDPASACWQCVPE